MATLYLTEPRSLVKKDGDTLAVHIPEDKERGTEKRQVRFVGAGNQQTGSTLFITCADK